jgi:hypothetical protein
MRCWHSYIVFLRQIDIPLKMRYPKDTLGQVKKIAIRRKKSQKKFGLIVTNKLPLHRSMRV